MDYSINFPLNKTNNKYSYHVFPTYCIYRSIPVILRLLDCRNYTEKYCLVSDIESYEETKEKFNEIKIDPIDNRPFFVAKKVENSTTHLLYLFYDLYNTKLDDIVFQNIYMYKMKLLIYQYHLSGIISSTIDDQFIDILRTPPGNEMIANNIRPCFYCRSTNDFSDLKTLNDYLNLNNKDYRSLFSLYNITLIITTDTPINKIKFNLNMFDSKLFSQIFSIESLMMCCLDHCKTCPHIIVSDDEFDEYCKNNSFLIKKENLPVIQSNDAIAKFIGLRPKQICKKIRRNENNGLNVSYYYCINTSSQFFTTKKKKATEKIISETI